MTCVGWGASSAPHTPKLPTYTNQMHIEGDECPRLTYTSLLGWGALSPHPRPVNLFFPVQPLSNSSHYSGKHNSGDKWHYSDKDYSSLVTHARTTKMSMPNGFSKCTALAKHAFRFTPGYCSAISCSSAL